MMNTKAALGARIILGMIYVVFGLNGFLQFIPQSAMPPLPEKAVAYMAGLMAAPYFFPVLKATEVIAGAALTTGFFAPLALIVLAPITIQIVLFHLILAPAGSAMAIVMLVAHLTAATRYWLYYRPLLRIR